MNRPLNDLGWPRPITLLLALLTLAISVLSASAQVVVTRPNSVPPGIAGFKVEIASLVSNDAIVCNNSFRVKMTRQPAAAKAVDEAFTVSLRSEYGFNWDSSASITQRRFVLPAGKTSIEVEVVAENGVTESTYGSLMVLVEQGRGNGKYDPSDLAIEHFDSSWIPNRVMPGGIVEPSWLLISSQSPKANGRVHYYWRGMTESERFGGRTGGMGWGGIAMARSTQSGPDITKIFPGRFLNAPASTIGNDLNWTLTHPQTLPESWRGLMSFNRIMIGWSDFQKLCQQDSQRAVLADWVAAGGDLVVFNSNDTLDHAFDLVPELIGRDQARLQQTKYRGFKNSGARLQTYLVPMDEPIKAGDREQAMENCRMIFSSLAKGQVWAIGDVASRNSLSLPQLSQAVEASGSGPILPTNSSSNNNSSGSPLKGVGEPPVAVFLFLVGLFLTLVGPVMLGLVFLRVFDRLSEHLYLMVPPFSLLICLGILGYAIVADYGKQVARANTLTVLHPETGMAYTQATAAYYCGHDPRYYEFDDRTSVLVPSFENNDSGLEYEYLDDKVRLRNSRIQARRVHRVFTHRPAATAMRVEIGNLDEAGNLNIRNQLDTDIRTMLIRHSDQIYRAESLSAGASGLARPLDETESTTSVRKLFSPESDQELFGPRHFFYSECDAWLVSGKLLPNPDTFLSLDGEFIAVVESDPLAEPMLQPYDYQHKLHLIHGKY